MADPAPGPPGTGAGSTEPPRGPGPVPARPDPVLADAAAMVFVPDLGAPTPSEAEAHHLLDVLRLRPGEPVVASDGAGRWVLCRVAAGARSGRSSASRRASVLEVDGAVVLAPAAEPALTVGFVPTKGDRPEWVTQKLTELGVDRIVPVRSARSVVRWEGERGARAVERLRRVAREAAAQCRRPWLPEIPAVLTLPELAELAERADLAEPAEPTGPGSSGEERVPFRLAQPGGMPPTLEPPTLVVGPEGGWDPDELARYGPGVGLGATVLRGETAAVAAAAVLGVLRSGLVRPVA